MAQVEALELGAVDGAWLAHSPIKHRTPNFQ
jgi:hypothetical protein